MHNPPMIALVDDDDHVRVATGSLIRSLGLRVSAFGSAEEFLASQLLSEVDCLITDMQMPGMSGLELKRQLLAEGRDIPAIMVTAYPEERLKEQAESAGFVGFFMKPFDGQIMADSILAALKRTGRMP